MHLHHDSLGLPDFWKTIGKIQERLSLDDAETSHFLSLSSTHFQAARTKKKPLKIDHVWKFSQHIHVGMNKIIEDNFDYVAMEKHFNGEKDYVPERYKEVALTSIHHTGVALDYLLKEYGEKVIHEALRFLQINKEAFNKNGQVNVHLLSDLFSFIASFSEKEEVFSQIGSSKMSNSFSDFPSEVIATKSLKEVYSYLFNNEETYWTTDHLYFSADSVTVKFKPRSFLNKEYGNKYMCLFRQGLLQGVGKIYSKSYTTVEKTDCYHTGGAYCEYKLNYGILQ